MKKKQTNRKGKLSLITSLLFAIAAAFGYEFSPEFQMAINTLLVEFAMVIL